MLCATFILVLRSQIALILVQQIDVTTVVVFCVYLNLLIWAVCFIPTAHTPISPAGPAKGKKKAKGQIILVWHYCIILVVPKTRALARPFSHLFAHFPITLFHAYTSVQVRSHPKTDLPGVHTWSVGSARAPLNIVASGTHRDALSNTYRQHV